MKKLIAVSGAIALLLALSASPAQADPSSKAFELAANATGQTSESAEPRAIPGIIALAVGAARLLTVARVPQAVTNMARTAGLTAGGVFSVSPSIGPDVDKAFD